MSLQVPFVRYPAVSPPTRGTRGTRGTNYPPRIPFNIPFYPPFLPQAHWFVRPVFPRAFTLQPMLQLPPSSEAVDKFSIPCQKCKRFGHLLINMCRKTHRCQISTKENNVITALVSKAKLCPVSKRKIICVRCGSPNVTRLKCKDCAPPVVMPQNRPLLAVTIFGKTFKIVIDTGARICVANEHLKAHLTANNQKFSLQDMKISGTVGISERRVLQVATVAVCVAEVAIATSFVIIPESNESVLGIDFIRNAGMLLDFRDGIWSLRGIAGENPMQYEELRQDEEI